jgi:hypothetical protein
MVQALAGVALLEFTEVKACAEMVSLAAKHGGLCLGRKIFKLVPQRKNQGVTQGVAFGRARQADHGDTAVHFEMKVFWGHVSRFLEANYGYE